MLINLSDILSTDHRTAKHVVPIDMTEVKTDFGVFPVQSAEDLNLKITHEKEGRLYIQGRTSMIIVIPCDRCLADVPTEFDLDFTKSIDLNVDQETEELDEKNYIDGYNLDVYKLLFNEILVGWPMKVLCREDCRGLCNVCGQNLNEGTCDCEDTSLDPRMSVIRDVFKNFKEV